MENIKDYYLEYIKIKQSYTRASKLQDEKFAKMQSRIAQLEAQIYTLRKELRQFKSTNKPNNFEDVIENTCRVFQITRDELIKKCRLRELVIARQLCFYILRNEFNLTLKQIGLIFKMHHSTIIYNLEQADNYMANERMYHYEIEMYNKIRGL